MLDDYTEKQKELFEEFQQPQKGFKFFKTGSRFLQNRLFILQLSIEKLVFFLIAVVIIIIVTFCFGVERGKHILVPAKVVVATSPPMVPATQVNQIPGAIYTIRIASLRSKQSAKKDLDKIKQAGFPAYITSSGEYFIVCVGDYKDKKQAEAVLSILKKDYKDSYIKRKE